MNSQTNNESREVSSDLENHSHLAWLRSLLANRVDSSTLATFRIVWGLLLTWEAIRKFPKASGMYSPEFFHFKYSLFPFVEPLPTVGLMKAEIAMMGLAGLLIAAGRLFRPASAVYLLIYLHLFLIEKMYYNNHFYLTMLIVFLLMLTEAGKSFRLPLPRRIKSDSPSVQTVPFWNLFVLRGQIIVLYFFGAVAKVNSDWLQGEPVRQWFAAKSPNHHLGFLLSEEWFVWFVCWSGLLLDLLVGFLLLFRRTRVPSILALIVFHGMNHQIFKIGLFPLLAMSMVILFIDLDRPRKLIHWVKIKVWSKTSQEKLTAPEPIKSSLPLHWGWTTLVIGWLAFQCTGSYGVRSRKRSAPGRFKLPFEGWDIRSRDDLSVPAVGSRRLRRGGRHSWRN